MSLKYTWFLSFIFFFCSCGQTYNSHTGDINLISSSYCSDQSDLRLCAANEVLQTKCANCHTSSIHSSWTSYDTNEEWLGSGYINAGDAANSQLITKLKNYGGNMPELAPELSEEELQALLDWIDALE